MRRLPPWQWLAVTMEWAIDHVPPFILRPLMMKFLTTALAPSTTLFDAGAVLVNRRGERFGDERDRPAWRLPDRRWITSHKVVREGCSAVVVPQLSLCEGMPR